MDEVSNPPVRLSNIQGNILAGFNKGFQDFLFLTFANRSTARAWIEEITSSPIGVANSHSRKVLDFNAAFKGNTSIKAEWVHLALSYRGLQFIGIPDDELDKFPDAFREGMAARAEILGDEGRSAPDRWLKPFDDSCSHIHAVLIAAADDLATLNSRTRAICGTPFFTKGIARHAKLEGRARQGREKGHEHFGFKDGVSQPGIRGVQAQRDGRLLLWPGEFVLGYPTQNNKAKNDHEGPNPDPGPISRGGPGWARDGSYMVFRKLSQDVAAFEKQLQEFANEHISADMVGAKMVGRFKSGQLLEPATGGVCPIGAHIQKVYPRDERMFKRSLDMRSEVETHRLIRRGIPFGPSFSASKPTSQNAHRGLLFVAYQSSIESQFEFIQQKWINYWKFPEIPGESTPGQDPIAAMSPNGQFQMDKDKESINIRHYVTMAGGEYFFSPSIEALRGITSHD